MTTCKPDSHEFRLQGRSYYKEFSPRKIGPLGLPEYKQDVSFRMLFCPKCGETKEIISQDHRTGEEQ